MQKGNSNLLTLVFGSKLLEHWCGDGKKLEGWKIKHPKPTQVHLGHSTSTNVSREFIEIKSIDGVSPLPLVKLLNGNENRKTKQSICCETEPLVRLPRHQTFLNYLI
jgi:hypothetical protein